MQSVSHFLPPSYVFEDMRRILAGRQLSGALLAWAGGLAALDVVLAAWLFARFHRRAVRTGLLARYRAETVG